MVLFVFDDVVSIVDEGYQQIENGYGIFGDGSMQVFVCIDMFGVIFVMWVWWFGWYGSDICCYKLWYLWVYLLVWWKDGDQDSGVGCWGVQCYVGCWLMISEYIGLMKLGVVI